MEDRQSVTPMKPFEEFMGLFLRHERKLFRYIVTLLSSTSDAEDVLQETALLLWRKFDEYERGTNFHAWACRTAQLKVFEHRRKNRHVVSVLDPDVLEQLASDSIQKAGQLEARLGALETCLEKLRQTDRELIRQRYARGKSGIDVAASLGRPANSVYQSLGRIRRALLECMNRTLAADGTSGEA